MKNKLTVIFEIESHRDITMAEVNTMARIIDADVVWSEMTDLAAKLHKIQVIIDGRDDEEEA